MSLKGKKTFVRKTNPLNLYKWTPFDDNKKRQKRNRVRGPVQFCNATAGSQGVDNIVTYVYNPSGNNHVAYVECDYVE